MKRIPLPISLMILTLMIPLLIAGCEDKVNPISPHWRTWKNGDTVPGYVLAQPSGSRADVEAKAQMWDNYWALELAVDLNTGNNDDNIFTLGEDVVFSLYISNESNDIWNGVHLIHLVYKFPDYFPCEWAPDTVSVFDLKAWDIESPTIDGDGSDVIWQTLQHNEVKWETKLEMSGVSGDNGLNEAFLIAAHDSSKIYFKLAWPDPNATADMAKDMWHYDGHTKWSRGSEEEDMVMFLFPTEQAPTDWEILGGATFFPGEEHPADGWVNVWRWHAGLTNPMGWADDLLATASGLEEDEGVSGYWENDDSAKFYPPFVQDPTIEPSSGWEVLLESEAIAFEETLRP